MVQEGDLGCCDARHHGLIDTLPAFWKTRRLWGAFRGVDPAGSLFRDGMAAVEGAGEAEGDRRDELHGEAITAFLIDQEMAPVVFVSDPADDGAGCGAEEDSAPAGMSEAEALDILELEPGAGPDAIAEAHGRLIQRLDPERGGSGHLTGLVNRAKDVLLA